MTQYNTLNVKLSNLQLNKLKSGIKNNTDITLKTSSNVVGDSNDKNNFPHKLLLTNMQVSKILKLLQMVHQFLQSFCKWHWVGVQQGQSYLMGEKVPP